MAKNERFEKVYEQGVMQTIEIWVDKQTGVNYLYRQSGYSGGADTSVGCRWKACGHTDGKLKRGLLCK